METELGEVDTASPMHSQSVQYNTPESDQLYKCEHCTKIYAYHSVWLHHQMKHSNIKDYVCSICQANLKYDRNLRQHIIKFHPEDARSAEQTYRQDATKQRVSEYLCFKCGRISNNNSNLLGHLNLMHGDGTKSEFTETKSEAIPKLNNLLGCISL